MHYTLLVPTILLLTKLIVAASTKRRATFLDVTILAKNKNLGGLGEVITILISDSADCGVRDNNNITDNNRLAVFTTLHNCY